MAASDQAPKFSVCVPNFNYAHYIGKTITSVQAQTFSDFELLVSDNCSTDDSLRVIESFASDRRLKYRVNPRNLGFSMNLLRAAEMATGSFMIMLSSDDMMDPAALETYAKLFDALGDEASYAVVGSSRLVIDEHDAVLKRQDVNMKLWRGAEIDSSLSRVIGVRIYRLAAEKLLRNSMLLMRSPFYFVSTAYPRSLCESIGGYSQGGLINPDKRFAWSLLGRAKQAYFIEQPLFLYRWHAANQTALQKASGALKHSVDEYVASFDTPADLLARAGVTRPQLEAAFIEQDIALRGLRALAEGNSAHARRLLRFGEAAYPSRMRGCRNVLVLRALLGLGPIGRFVAGKFKNRAMRAWEEELSTPSAEYAGGRSMVRPPDIA
jgi:glycosyltransferase involved in cell wall biosynthesis